MSEPSWLAGLLPLAVFAFVASVTPGPNNLMLLASGVNFGFRRTVPHMLGISTGMVVMVLALGLGLWPLLAARPGLAAAMRWLGAAWMLWLAWKIVRAAAPDAPDASPARPFGFLAAAAFQWVNPKAWVMVVSALATYGTGAGWMAMVFVAVGLPAIALWAGFGVGLRRWLADPRRRRPFNWVMAGLLVASLVPLLAG
ncbi:LysE family translocator [Roseomonas sp. OT10]|uniref:LysE family translocator n=1 Tax=Roseomonas cutis TaxID=2897332 RepID=UPI001E4F8BD3|nr:LysE family translocator [Roseomonas sp. OT10]UFN48961.1 LysE family translocator [Roseomonas sp. OT10]